MDSTDADVSKDDANAVVGSSIDSLSSPSAADDQPPAVDMKEVDKAIDDDAPGEEPTVAEASSPDGPSGDAAAPPISAPSSPPAASPPISPPPPPPPPPPQPLYDLSSMISTALSSKNFSSFLLRLEDIELEAPDGVPPADVYGCMLTANLIVNDIVNAKLLWKRIPTRVKTEHPEFESLWRIGTKLWASEFNVAFAELSRREWSPLMQPLAACLSDSVRRRVVSLIEKSYESLRLSCMSALLGLTNEESQFALASERDWPVAQGYACPSKKRPTPDSTRRIRVDDGGDALQRLTDYVAFLEE